MKKRITANLYTETRFVWQNREDVIVRNEDGTLFSQGRYRTKIFASDLPEWYVRGRYYKQTGWLSAKGVRDLYYCPNFFTNHMFKDDFLFVSYDQQIMPGQDVLHITGAEEHVSGWDIVVFLKAVEQFSGYDISASKETIEKKRIWFKEHYPTDYDHEVGRHESIFS